MKSLQNAVICGLIALGAAAPAAQAAYLGNADIKLGTSVVNFRGINLDSYNGKYASLIVLKGDKTLGDMTAADVEKEEFIKIENGGFNYSFELNAPADKNTYTAYIKAENTERVSKLIYSADSENIYSAVTAKTTAAEFAAEIETNAEALNLNDTVYEKLSDKAAAAEMLFNGIKNGDVTVTDAETLKNAVILYANIEALNENNKELVFDEAAFIAEEALGMDKLDGDYGVRAYSLYNTAIKPTGKNNVINALCKKNFKDIKAFKEAFVFESTLQAVKNNKSAGTGHISGILEANNAVNKLDLSNYKSVKGNTIDTKLLESAYSTKAEMQSILNTKASDDSKNNSGKDSGGSSGNNKVPSVGGGTTYTPVISKPDDNTDNEASTVFSDVTNAYSWAKNAIEQLYDDGIVDGKADGLFAPGDKVTRAEFLKILMGALKISADDGDCSFEDVSADDWYYKFVAAAYNSGIVKGMSDSYFGAKENITRQDAAVLMLRAVEYLEKKLPSDGEAISFDDEAEISEYAKSAVEALTKAGILHGSEGMYRPGANCTRAEAAVMINNIRGMFKAEEN